MRLVDCHVARAAHSHRFSRQHTGWRKRKWACRLLKKIDPHTHMTHNRSIIIMRQSYQTRASCQPSTFLPFHRLTTLRLPHGPSMAS